MAQLKDLLVLGNSNLLGSVNILGELVASIFSGDGSKLTNLNASEIKSGTLDVARLATSGVTAGTKGATAAATLSHGTTFKVPKVTVDKYGRVTGLTEYTMTAVGNTAGTTNSSSKLFIAGATSQGTAPQTYSNVNNYIGADGFIYSGTPETSGHSTRIVTQGATNTFTGTNFFTATNTYNTAATQKFMIGNTSSMWVVGGDGMQCFSGTNAPTTAKMGYLQYYGGGLQIGSSGTVSNTSIYGDLTLYKNSGATAGGNLSVPGAATITGNITSNGHLILQGNNTDNFVYYNHTGSETGYDWRAGALGTGSGDANYYAIQSNGSTNEWKNVIRLGLTSYNLIFGDANANGILYPYTTGASSLGQLDNVWLNIYGKTLTAADVTNKVAVGTLRCETTGTTSTQGEAYLTVGNGTASSNAGNSRGSIFLYGTNKAYTRLVPSSNSTTNRTLYLPDAGGELVYHTDNTAIGGTTQPVYIAKSGQATAITAVGTAYGGTGNTAYEANRMVWTETATKLTGSSHYVDADHLAVNTTDIQTNYNFYVNGTTGFSGGHVYFTGAAASSSTANTTQIVFGTVADPHVALSSNTKALVINPNTTATTNQIVLYLDSQSKIPSGIDAGSSKFTALTATTGTITTLTSTTGNITTVNATTVKASQQLIVNQTDGVKGYGLSLYGNSSTPQSYGIYFAKTETFGTYGDITGDWATYFGMANGTTRGWIFRYSDGTKAASLSARGNFTVAGYTKINNKVKLEYVAATDSLDFIFD